MLRCGHIEGVWPTPQDYNEAVQTPDYAFANAELRKSIPELNALGLPKPVSGSFASVYRLRSATGAQWAVRCFLRNVQNQEERYAAISDHLARHPLDCMVPFEFIQQGIRVNGQWFPILKMQWVDGIPLLTWIERHLHDTAALVELQRSLKEVCQELAANGIAHGDFQHGNIFVTDNAALRLVDYDGLFVPDLESMGSAELGHRHYQHPRRKTKHYGAYLDNFSAWSIYASLHCLEQDARIWRKLGAGDECLVFRQEDYLHPADSVAFSFLEQHDSAVVRETSRTLRRLLAVEPEDVPPLGEPIAGVSEIEEVPPLTLPLHFGDVAKSPGEVLVNLRIAVAEARAPRLVVDDPEERIVEAPAHKNPPAWLPTPPATPPVVQTVTPTNVPRSRNNTFKWLAATWLIGSFAVSLWNPDYPRLPPVVSDQTTESTSVTFAPGNYAIIEDLSNPLSAKLDSSSPHVQKYRAAYALFEQKYYDAAFDVFKSIVDSGRFYVGFDRFLCDYMKAKCLIAQNQSAKAIPLMEAVRAQCAKEKFWIPDIATELAQAQMSTSQYADAIHTVISDLPLARRSTVISKEVQILRQASLSAIERDDAYGYIGYDTFINELHALKFPNLAFSVEKDLTTAAAEAGSKSLSVEIRIREYARKVLSRPPLAKDTKH